ncbi:hypothetical protein SFC55_24615 [Niallia taxi]|uniref:hypothetical protein n=1 Tax=Niallia taxi TaxID=2499688 RepID=UPI0039826D42
MDAISSLIANIFQWGQQQSLWMQIFLILVGIILILLFLFLGIMITSYIPCYLLGRYLGVFSILLIIPTLGVIISEPLTAGAINIPNFLVTLIILLTICGYGFVEGIKDRKKANERKRIAKLSS